MDKKSVIGLILCLLLLLAAAGCSKTNTSTTAGNSTTQTADQQNTASQATGNANQSSSNTNAGNPGNGQTTPDLFGQVKSVSGSTITLALAKTPQQGNTPPQNPPVAQGQTASQAPKNMGSPELTGETKTITIPDGVKITTGNKDSSKEVSISSIKAGDMLEVTLKDGVVSQVRVMQAPPQQ